VALASLLARCGLTAAPDSSEDLLFAGITPEPAAATGPVTAIPPALRDLIARCLTPSPAHRPTAASLLAHPFLSGASTRRWVPRPRLRCMEPLVLPAAAAEDAAAARDPLAERPMAEVWCRRMSERRSRR
jgi:hypothetical protein